MDFLFFFPCDRDVTSMTDSHSCFHIPNELKVISRYGVLRAGSHYNGLKLSFASLENNSELSIQEQDLVLILVCG